MQFDDTPSEPIEIAHRAGAPSFNADVNVNEPNISTLDSGYNNGLFNLSVDLLSNEPSSGKYVFKALLSRIGEKSETVYDTTYKTKIDSAKTIWFKKTCYE